MEATPDVVVQRADGHTCSRVVIVDDHAIVRQGLAAILELEGDFQVVGEAGSCEAAMRVIEERRPHLVLVDLKLNDNDPPDGLALCSAIVERHADVGVVVLTTFLDEALVEEAVRRGAKGYALKDVDVAELARIMRAVRGGQSGFDNRSATAVARALTNEYSAPAPPALTSRHLEILRLMATGMSNREIAGQLYLSPSTVKFHVGNLMRAFGAKHRAEVVYKATQAHLL